MGIQILQTAFTARQVNSCLTSSTAVAVTGATLDLDINYGGVLLASDSMSIEVNVLFTNCTIGCGLINGGNVSGCTIDATAQGQLTTFHKCANRCPIHAQPSGVMLMVAIESIIDLKTIGFAETGHGVVRTAQLITDEPATLK